MEVGQGRKGQLKEEGRKTDLPTIYDISSELIGHKRTWCNAQMNWIIGVVLAQVVVADPCCGRAFNGSDFLHFSQLSRL
jgi:hypothetical protein